MGLRASSPQYVATAADGTLAPLMVEQLLWTLFGANMNSTADQGFTRRWSFTSFQISRIVVTNSSAALTLAAGGIYPNVNKTGAPLVAASQVYSGLVETVGGLLATLTEVGLGISSASMLNLSLTTAQGVASTADFRIYGTPLS